MCSYFKQTKIFLFFTYKIREQEGRKSPAWGALVFVITWGEERAWGSKENTYINRKEIPAETFSAMVIVWDKGECGQIRVWYI
jgi:hypothetical protein